MRLSSLACLLLFLLNGCTTIPDQFEQQASSAWHEPESTRMGAFFQQSDGAGAGRSGVRLLPRGDEAFVTYDWYPYNIGEPINIDPNSSWTYIKLTMEASRTEWTEGNELSGKICFLIS